VADTPGYGERAESAELVKHDDETEVVRIIIEARQGGASYREICTLLTDTGLPPRQAGTWHPMVVRSIVQRHG
jgi:hypothetical protein